MHLCACQVPYTPSRHSRQLNFSARQITFQSSLLNGQGPRQVMCQLNNIVLIDQVGGLDRKIFGSKSGHTDRAHRSVS